MDRYPGRTPGDAGWQPGSTPSPSRLHLPGTAADVCAQLVDPGTDPVGLDAAEKRVVADLLANGPVTVVIGRPSLAESAETIEAAAAVLLEHLPQVGFLPALRSPDALVITAARKDRTSFGCGASSHVTWFGQAWLVDGLNRHDGFIQAFEEARREVARREEAEGFSASYPQIHVGERIRPVLDAWRASVPAGPAVAYPWETPPEPAAEAASDR